MARWFKAVSLSGAGLLALLAAATASANSISAAPPALVSAMAESAAGAAARDPAYAIGTNGCANLPSGHASLNGCFRPQGTRFTAGDQQLEIRLTGWGRGDHLNTVKLRRGAPQANRIEYAGHGIREWWRVLPFGYEQGFTIEQLPGGRGDVVLELTAGAEPVVAHDGSLGWRDLRYGKLQVTDATGATLPAQMTAVGRTVRLTFDAAQARFPVTVDPLVWIEQKLVDEDIGTNFHFGWSVALSNDGSTALVGAYGTSAGGVSNAGAGYVFTRSGNSWSQVAKLTSSTAGEEHFGFDVALSADGGTALVGAPIRKVGSNIWQGAAYIFSRPAAGWASATESAMLTAGNAANTRLGFGVALSPDGSVALAGVPYNTIAGKTYQGSAFLFVRPNTGWVTTSSATQEITASDGAAMDWFGRSLVVSIGGDVVLVGAPDHSSGRGAAYVFTKGSGNTWSQAATLTASDGAANARFGYGVALSADGATALIGAYNSGFSGTGAAYIFQKPASGWGTATQTARLTASDASANDYFGNSVCLSADGTAALVGSFESNAKHGAAYLFRAPGSGWADSSAEASRFTATDGAANDAFGSDVALSSDGAIVLVGADEKTVGSNTMQGEAYLFTISSLTAALNVATNLLQGATYDFQYRVTNGGAATSAPLNVQLLLPVGTDYQSATATQGSCSFDNVAALATCELGGIAAGATVTSALSVTLTASPGATVTHAARLANGTPDLGANAISNVVTAVHVTYDGNGHTSGTVPTDGAAYGPGATVTVAGAGDLARDGYTFNGWNTLANGSGTGYAPAATFNISGDITLYAQWVAQGGGSGGGGGALGVAGLGLLALFAWRRRIARVC